MKKSLIDIKELLNDIVNDHANINEFHFGSFVEATSGDAVTYPLLVATVQPSTLTYKKSNISVTLSFADKYVQSNYEMRDEVLSDLFEVAGDVRALMRKEIYDAFEISDTLPLRPFVNYDGDYTCGWMMDIKFEIDDLMNYCAVPN